MNDRRLAELEGAVRDRRVVQFAYDGQPRSVQPVAVGRHRVTGQPMLRGYQVAGRSNSRTPPFWLFFAIDRIVDLVASDQVFATDPPHYPDRDGHLCPITAELRRPSSDAAHSPE